MCLKYYQNCHQSADKESPKNPFQKHDPESNNNSLEL